MDELTTWDGKPVSRETPRGATVIIYRYMADGIEFLLLHRAFNGIDFEGDWAWTPPSGARLPGEGIEACASRELVEETGLEIPLQFMDFSRPDWWVYSAEIEVEAAIRLDGEHDRFAWFPPVEAVQLCKPDIVSEPVEKMRQALAISPEK